MWYHMVFVFLFLTDFPHFPVPCLPFKPLPWVTSDIPESVVFFPTPMARGSSWARDQTQDAGGSDNTRSLNHCAMRKFPKSVISLRIHHGDVPFPPNCYFPNTCFFYCTQHGDPVTHTCIHSFFSHYHAPSKVTRQSPQCYTAGSPCWSTPKATVCIY